MHKHTVLAFVSVVLITSLFVVGGNSSAKSPQRVGIELEPPPKSLDKFYPPLAKGPVYLIEMVKLAHIFQSTNLDVRQGDWENAQRGFAGFKEQMSKLSNMVPEWKHYFKMDLVVKLGRAIETKKVPVIMKVRNEKIGSQICGGCHIANRLSVWYRYHWKDFGKIMVDDPISKKKLTFRDFKFRLAGSWEGIDVDMRQHQTDRARKSFKAFTAQVEALKKSCNECHDPKKGERKYFITPDIMGKISDMGTEISKPSPTPEKLESLFVEIGREMCYRCHQVHWPAATVQRVWRDHGNPPK